MAVVHYAITRRVRPGAEAEFDARLLEFIRKTMAVDGVVGIHVLRPAPGMNDREYGILRSFESEAAADRFYASEVFVRWQAEVEPLVEGEPVSRRLSGLEAFFRTGPHRLPPRWKMAIVTFLGVLPSVLLWSAVLGPLLEGQHWLLRAVAINLAVVSTLTWGVMPWLTRWLRPWLSGEK